MDTGGRRGHLAHGRVGEGVCNLVRMCAVLALVNLGRGPALHTKRIRECLEAVSQSVRKCFCQRALWIRSGIGSRHLPLATARGKLSCALCVLVAAMQFTKTLLALAAVFGAVFQLQGCAASTTAAPGNSSNSTRMLEDAELLA